MFGFMVWCPWRWNNKVLREILKHKKKKEKNEGQLDYKTCIVARTKNVAMWFL